jgi:hypothetical protein
MVEDQMLENQLKEGQKQRSRGKLQRTTGTFYGPGRQTVREQVEMII